MEEQETPSADYIKGFNEGYIITKHLPDHAQKIRSSLPDSDRSKGFRAGSHQYQIEKNKERHPFMQKFRAPTETEMDKHKTNDHSMDEPEH